MIRGLQEWITAALIIIALCCPGLGQSPIQAAGNPAPVVIVDGRPAADTPNGRRPGQPAADDARWETSPSIRQAVAAARKYWAAKTPDYQERLRILGSIGGAFTAPDVEQHAVLYMMSDTPRGFPPMGLAIVEGDRLVRNIAFATIAQSISSLTDIDGDGRDELVFGGGFIGQGMVSEGINLASFDDEKLDDFGSAIIFESACGAGYGDRESFAARLSVVAGAGIIVEHYRQPSCDTATWEPVGQPQPLNPISTGKKTVYTEIPVKVTVTD